MRQLNFLSQAALLGALALFVGACGTEADGYVEGQTEFVSANPNGGYGGELDAAGGGRDGEAAPNSGDQGATPREVEEADIVRVDGNLLYVLNQYRGLQVIDITNPDQPALIGMAPVAGYPIEMYIRDNRAYVVISNYFDYWYATDAVAGATWGAYRGSQIRVFDISNPTAPVSLTHFNVSGEVTDTRIVGDVLYAVSNRYGWYESYSTTDTVEGTYILSINIADESNIHQVDQEVFPRQGWDNHVHVTSNTIYVASSGWANSSYETRIKVVDISDPQGQIVLQGESLVDGWVRDRWQLDEYAGHFRVVTAPDWNGTAPKVYTFRIDQGGMLTQLAMLPVQLPRPESLTAVRFDGDTAYVVTYERVDPLFIIDLSNPAAPLQRGELEMPGWLDHIAPRGDRLVALGHDDTNDWQLAVSLFDVSDLDAPALLGRVSFGENWGWIPDERDNFDKVFKVLDAQGLVLVPFHSYGFDETTGYWHHKGGVQLVDFDRQSVTLRGLADHGGYVKRAIPHGDRILTVSNERMQTVNIANRDNPVTTGSVELARNVVDFVTLGAFGVQLVGDWYRGDTRLVVVPLSDYDLGAPVAEMQVTAPYGRMFVDGNFIYLASRDWQSGETKITIFDFTIPSAPVQRGEVILPEEVSYWGGYWYGWYGGDEVAQVNGSTLVFHTYRYWYRGYEDNAGTVYPDSHFDHLYVVDLANKDNPALASTIVLRNEDWVFGLGAKANTLFFTHYEYAGQDSQGRSLSRYYLDRIDLTNPAHPVRQAKVNVPGYVLDLSDDLSTVYTLDYAWTNAQNSYGVTYAFNALDLRGRAAYLRGRLVLDGYVGNAVVDGTKAYLTRNDWGQDANGDYWNASYFDVIDLTVSNRLTLAADVSLPDDWGYLRKVEGERAFVDLGWRGGLLIYDVSDATNVGLAGFHRHPGWVNAIHVDGATAYVALGYYGVSAIGLGGVF
ncbi:MAG: beta-propeller domain-containing protein [Deltaproteobacteria bacterium]|nr:beta-propeller domain-containing protein [Deltaproteobacteria bacterium]